MTATSLQIEARKARFMRAVDSIDTEHEYMRKADVLLSSREYLDAPLAAQGEMVAYLEAKRAELAGKAGAP